MKPRTTLPTLAPGIAIDHYRRPTAWRRFWRALFAIFSRS
jgi:hypothetical protein